MKKFILQRKELKRKKLEDEKFEKGKSKEWVAWYAARKEVRKGTKHKRYNIPFNIVAPALFTHLSQNS